jgi:predicted DsbA family dithiol-disulfide isomerase
VSSGGNRLGIAVHFDLICPWCFIGKRHLETARRRFAQSSPGVTVQTRWHPVQLLPDLPEAGVPFDEFYEQRLGSPEAVRQRRAQVARAAQGAGLELDFDAIRRMPNTARAHSLLRRVALLHNPELYEALLERLFAAHFQRGADIGDAAVLQSLATQVGVPLAFIDEAPAAAPLPPAEAATMGVPYFVFDEGISLSGAHDASVLLTAMNLAARAPGTLRMAASEPALCEAGR